MIDKTAVIESGAEIADGVQIGAGAFIGRGVRLARGAKVGHGAHIEGLTEIGENTAISPLVSLGTPPQDLKYKGEPTRLIIGANTRIREFTQINTGTVGGGGVTRIGDNCLIMGHCHLGHDVQIGANTVIANFAVLAGHVEVANNVVIGGASAIHQFCKIGEFCMIGGASALAQDAPPYCLLEGNRAFLRGLNAIGLRRNLGRESVDLLKPIYKRLFRSNESPKEAAKDLLAQHDNRLIKNLCEFVINSQRGIPTKRTKDEE